MTNPEKVREEKLMAVENIILSLRRNEFNQSFYETAQEILSAIEAIDIKEELRQHELNLEIASENKPE